METKMKFGLSQYYEPTPKNIRKLADAILGATMFLSASAIIADYHWLAITSVVVGAVAKFFSNFFSDDNNV